MSELLNECPECGAHIATTNASLTECAARCGWFAKPKLQPCPLCPDGGKPYYTKSVNGSSMIYVGCSQCGLELKAMLVMVTPVDEAPTKDIVALWNTRTPSDAAVRAAAEEIANYLANNTVKIYGSVDKFEAIITKHLLAARTGELQ